MKARCVGLRILAGIFFFSLSAIAAAPSGKPTIVLISGEFEYKSAETLPAFQKQLESTHSFRCIYLQRTQGEDIPGLESLEKADLVVLFARRMTLPEAQLAKVKTYVASGKPLIGLRTASHAFENWKEFDGEVLGGNYQRHYGNELIPTIRIVPEAAAHPILRGIEREFQSAGSLYRNSPLPASSVQLLTGTISDKISEPVAWTHPYKNARVFYTSLGHPKDFENPSFQRLLINAVYWALGLPAPGAPASAPVETGKPRKVGVDEFEQLWLEKKHTVLDVRTRKEFDAGHIPGAINLDINAADFEEKVSSLDKKQIYLVHCAAGARSARACEKMSRLDFKYLIDLAPGFREWEKAGKKVER